MGQATHVLVLMSHDPIEMASWFYPAEKALLGGGLDGKNRDEVYMAPAAELGPLDTQVFHESEGRPTSALDISGAMDFVVSSATAIALRLRGPWRYEPRNCPASRR